MYQVPPTLSKEANESPTFSRDRDIELVNDVNNNEEVTVYNSGPGCDSEVTKVITEADVCENVNVREMRKFFIEQGRRFTSTLMPKNYT